MGVLRSLRFQVSVAMLIVAVVCLYVASWKSGEEIHDAYRDAAQATLKAAAASFATDSHAAPRAALRRLMRNYPELQSASLYRSGRERPVASVGRRLPETAMESAQRSEASEHGHAAELLVTPVGRAGKGDSALALAYDMRPAHRLLDQRNERVLIALSLLAAAALACLILLLARAVFRPLDRLRAAAKAVGAGDLSPRLDWRRRDELGQLAGEFDSMAAHLEEHQHGLEELAHRDPLTELANHRRFQELLARQLDEARRSGRPFSVVLLDIDDFKRINEARGHPFGDELLGRAAAGLAAAMCDLGFVARVGGDQFGVVLPDADGPRALALGEAARTAVELSAPVQGMVR